MRVLAVLAVWLPVCFSLTVSAQERPTVRAARVEKGPVVDGSLDDAAWQAAPEIKGFTQHDPDDGKPSTEETIVRIVYTEEAIYFGALLKDRSKVTTLLTRRDNSLSESDYLKVSIDAEHDRLTGAAFMVNPSNVQVDMILHNDIAEDTSWDAVWESATRIVDGGWVAELRIPYSQLRYSDRSVHTWGINFTRRIQRNNENARLVNTPKGESGAVSRFADLVGLEGIRARRRFELSPYAVARSDVFTRYDARDPFMRSVDSRVDGGLDLKYGLTSGLTLTATINPDFGQVEVDPAVVNLTQFETSFPEKRPFFTEGASVFRFGEGPVNSRFGFNFGFPTFFYSRRIGRSPQGSVDADYLSSPHETTILGAAKITGKVGKGWTVGVLDALTDREDARFSRDGGFGDQAVEPMTNYLVARATKEYGKDSRLGFLFTSVNRRLPRDLRASLRENAYFAGVDGHSFFRDKAWIVEWLGGTSMVEGSAEAIALTQQASSRYYQRPDARHVEFDPTRTSLGGYGGRMTLNKQTGRWRPNLQVQAWSPGFEINDVGFNTRTDVVSSHAVLQYVDETVRKYTREVSVWASKYQNWNWDGDLTANGIYTDSYIQLKNYAYLFGGVYGSGERLDDRRARGGPAVLRPADLGGTAGVGTDSRKKVWFETWTEQQFYDDGGFNRFYGLTLNYRPNPAVRLRATPTFSRNRDYAQYVTTRSGHYIFATLEQRTLDVGLRAEWTVNARLSFQLYLQPFVASGAYHDFKELARGRSRDYTPAAPVANRDFNIRSVRGNAVVRWEFRPGSALYVVWNENREDVASVGDFRVRRDFAALPDARSQDVFLVKVSYWLPM